MNSPPKAERFSGFFCCLESKETAGKEKIASRHEIVVR
jgi:hypothetical protein